MTCASAAAVALLLLPAANTAQPARYLRTISVLGTTQFGVDLAAFGDQLLVGATYGDIFEARSGRAFLVDPESGAVLREFVNPARHAGDFYGKAISRFGDYVAVGAPGGTAYPGGDVYVFDPATGNVVGSFAGNEENDRFGWSLSSVGGKLYVGTPELRTGTQFNGQGRVHVINPSGDQLIVPNPAPVPNPNLFNDESFGYDLAARGNSAFVGALYDSDGGKVWEVSDSGAVIRRYDNPDGPLGNGGRPQFGVAVDALGGYLLVGANQSSASPSGITATGAAYLFDNTTGRLLHKFFDPVLGVLDNFGYSVALFQNYAVIGAHNDDDGHSQGAAFIFDLNTGAHLQTIETPYLSSRFFGVTMSRIGNGLLAVGDATGTGYVHIYAIPEPNTVALALAGVLPLLFIACRHGLARCEVQPRLPPSRVLRFEFLRTHGTPVKIQYSFPAALLARAVGRSATRRTCLAATSACSLAIAAARGIAPKSPSIRSRTLTVPCSASRGPTTDM